MLYSRNALLKCVSSSLCTWSTRFACEVVPIDNCASLNSLSTMRKAVLPLTPCSISSICLFMNLRAVGGSKLPRETGSNLACSQLEATKANDRLWSIMERKLAEANTACKKHLWILRIISLKQAILWEAYFWRPSSSFLLRWWHPVDCLQPHRLLHNTRTH